jgi:hypothetical protein
VGPAAQPRVAYAPAPRYAAACRWPLPGPGRSVPAVFRRAGPCRPTGVAGSPGTAWWNGPGRPEHASSRVGPCLGRAKKPGRVPGHQALGCMLIYRCIRAWEAELRRSVQLVRGMQEKRGLPAMTTQRRFPLNFSCYITFLSHHLHFIPYFFIFRNSSL